jgi:hypothetical protein
MTKVLFESLLPETSFYKLPSTGETILIKRGEKGYFPQKQLKHKNHNELNELYDITKAQAEAMFAGSLHGWDVPASNPELYDENGEIVRDRIDKIAEEIKELKGK